MPITPAATPPISSPTPPHHSLPAGWRLALLLFFSVVAGFSGGWVAMRTAEPASQITENRQALVLTESEVIAEVAESVSPSVVSIKARTTTTSAFFGALTAESAGTGIILTADGLIVTNKHVVNGSQSLTIITSDGTTYTDVSVVDQDPLNDVAFLRLNGASGLQPATLGDSSLVRVGEKVIAIGNALGQFSNTVTSGIISGLGRPVVAGGGSSTTESLQNLFQTDAAINPGNSGGPLVSIRGEVIGMNTAVAGNAENIGFAIPMNDIKPAITSVETHGRIIKPYLGVRYVNLTPALAGDLGLSHKQGALISGEGVSQPAVIPGSPAAKAGLQDGDIIVKVADVAIDERHPLATLLTQHAVGETVALTVVRQGQEQTFSVVLEEAPR